MHRSRSHEAPRHASDPDPCRRMLHRRHQRRHHVPPGDQAEPGRMRRHGESDSSRPPEAFPWRSQQPPDQQGHRETENRDSHIHHPEGAVGLGGRWIPFSPPMPLVPGLDRVDRSSAGKDAGQQHDHVSNDTNPHRTPPGTGGLPVHIPNASLTPLRTNWAATAARISPMIRVTTRIPVFPSRPSSGSPTRKARKEMIPVSTMEP